jgi:hypothetical protein
MKYAWAGLALALGAAYLRGDLLYAQRASHYWSNAFGG